MRTIKFRGKQYETGEWLVGDLIHFKHDVMILPLDANWFDFVPRKNNPLRLPSDRFVVDPETIGQFTGLTDKNGKEIYEGDIVQWGDSEHKIKQVVEFRNGAFGYVYDTIGSFVPYAANTNFDFAALGTDKRFEVVGNIHDNQDLIEKGGEHE